VTPGALDVDHAAVARAQAEVARAVAESREPRTVLEPAAARLHALIGARQCFVIVVRGDQRVRVVASSGLVSPLREVLPAHDRDGIAMPAMTERRTVASHDILNDPAIDVSPASRRFIEAEGYRGALAVPLVAATRVLGVLVAGRGEIGAFSREQVEVARAFGDLAALVREGACLTSREAARARIDETLAELEREMLAELTAERLFPLILERAGGLLHAKGSIHLAEPGRRWLRRVWSTSSSAR
jgi:GAF domain-containing protein